VEIVNAGPVSPISIEIWLAAALAMVRGNRERVHARLGAEVHVLEANVLGALARRCSIPSQRQCGRAPAGLHSIPESRTASRAANQRKTARSGPGDRVGEGEKCAAGS